MTTHQVTGKMSEKDVARQQRQAAKFFLGK